MSRDTNFEELFGNELAKSNDAGEKVLIHCPHCDEGITKSQVLEKAKHGTEGKMAGQNNDGKAKRAGGKDGEHNKKTPTRPKGASAKTNEPNPGAYDAKKSEGSEEAEEPETKEEIEQVAKSDSKCPQCGSKSMSGAMCKCGHKMAKSEDASAPSMRYLGGSQYVRYVDTGEDQRIAESIAKGMNGYNANDRTPHNGR